MIVTVTLNPCLDKVIELEALEPGEEIHACSVTQVAAGKGINVSRMVHHLGGETVALWVCGGLTGVRMGRLLRAEGIANQPLRVTGELRTNYTLVERGRSRATRIFEPGPAVSEGEARSISAAVLGRLRREDLLVLSGSLPSATLAGLYSGLISQAKEKGVKTILDSRDAALLSGLPAGPFLVKCNQGEAHEATGRPVHDFRTALEAAGLLRQSGPTFAVVSLGKVGAVLSGPGESWSAVPPGVKVASPVGSGDCMVAAMALGISRGWSPAEWMRWGVAAGAANAAVWTPGGCDREDVERLAPQVRMTVVVDLGRS
jgi:1-phosphofructokinase family hexose kinase